LLVTTFAPAATAAREPAIDVTRGQPALESADAVLETSGTAGTDPE
jgi:hypothetical protein